MKQPWIRNVAFDSIFFLAPLLGPLLILVFFPSIFTNEQDNIGIVSWILLVLLIDVSHVYSTIFRTYLNPRSVSKIRSRLYFIPLICWFVGVLLYSIEPMYFWRCLAYLAVFHFVRQQYGFMRIYSRTQNDGSLLKKLQAISIYTATIGPILIWHFSGPKKFNWFVEGDFIYGDSPAMIFILRILFFVCLALYTLSEFYLWVKQKRFNMPRFTLVLGTAASWYIGIVVYNGDLSFTALNVIAHGIPYMALVWHSEKKEDQRSNGILKYIFTRYGLVLFIGIIFLLAYFEEGLWDSLIWHEHRQIFKGFYFLGHVTHGGFLSFIIPLLALPQTVHYVLDAFIWKMRPEKKGWLKVF